MNLRASWTNENVQYDTPTLDSIAGADPIPDSIPASQDASTWSDYSGTSAANDNSAIPVIGGNVSDWISGIIGAGTSVFNTVSTIEANNAARDSAFQIAQANIARQQKADDAANALQVAKLNYATQVAAKGGVLPSAPASTITTNMILLGGAAVLAAYLILKKK